LFNKVWETGKLPSEWKHGVIVPIAKPGKDKALPRSYRPIALTLTYGENGNVKVSIFC